MRAIKNFIYNVSDIFIVLIILVLAVFLIWSRIIVVMDYPDSYDGSTSVSKVAAFFGVDTNANNPMIGGAANSREIVIPEGSTMDEVLNIVKQSRLVTDINNFAYQVSNMGLTGKIQSGTFVIPEGSSVEEMIYILCGMDPTTATEL